MKLLCTVPEAASMASVSRSFIYERLAEGAIRSVKAGKRRLVDVASLTAWTASLPTSVLKVTTRGGAR